MHFSLKSVFVMNARFELTTNDPCPTDDAICYGLRPLGYELVWLRASRDSFRSAVCVF